MKIIIPSHLSDTDLVAEVKSLAPLGREASAHLIAHLAEIDARRLHLTAAFPSLFAYCVQVLQLSESEAYNRIEAARAARKFPVILDRLADGSLNLTTVRLLASYLTADNHLELLAAASGKSRREVCAAAPTTTTRRSSSTGAHNRLVLERARHRCRRRRPGGRRATAIHALFA